MKRDKALKLALDAAALECSEKAAEANGVHRCTVDRAKQQVSADPELRAIAQLKKKEMAERLHDKRVEVIELMLDGMRERLPGMEDRDFVGAYKIVTDSHEVALRVIANGSEPLPSHRQPGEVDKQPASEGPRGVPVGLGGWLTGSAARPQ